MEIFQIINYCERSAKCVGTPHSRPPSSVGLYPPPPPREVGTSLYKLYRYALLQRVGFLDRFGLKTGTDFDHNGLKSGMVSKGTTGAYRRICLFNSK